jgi:AhpD family alkylhydroperoxidase
MMAKVEVFDPPMCCSTGVCGTSVDPALAEFAASLQWIAGQGASVTRYNLAQQPGPFAGHAGVRTLLAEGGEDALPAVLVDGELRSSGRYPARAELAAWALPAGPAEALDAVTAELVAIGAAVGANCEPCFRYHYGKAREAGAGTGTITAAVRLAQTVKDTPARSMLDLAARLLGTGPQALQATGSSERRPLPLADPAQAASPCCGGTAEAGESPAATVAAGEGGCCG